MVPFGEDGGEELSGIVGISPSHINLFKFGGENIWVDRTLQWVVNVSSSCKTGSNRLLLNSLHMMS